MVGCLICHVRIQVVYNIFRKRVKKKPDTHVLILVPIGKTVTEFFTHIYHHHTKYSGNQTEVGIMGNPHLI